MVLGFVVIEGGNMVMDVIEVMLISSPELAHCAPLAPAVVAAVTASKGFFFSIFFVHCLKNFEEKKLHINQKYLIEQFDIFSKRMYTYLKNK